MNELPTVSIALFDELGARAIFQIPIREGGDLAQAYRYNRDQLLQQGFSITQPTNSPAAKGKTERIKGYLWGSYMDKRTKELVPRLYIYNDNPRLEYPIVTVYPEHFDRLPVDVQGRKPKEIMDVITAPASNEVENSKRFVPWRAEIQLEPKTNAQGEIEMNAQGYPKYYNYVGVAGQTQAGHRNTPAQEPRIAPTRLQILVALGEAYHGTNDWPIKRDQSLRWVGAQRNPKVLIKEIEKLTEAEVEDWISLLEENGQQALDSEARGMELAKELADVEVA